MWREMEVDYWIDVAFKNSDCSVHIIQRPCRNPAIRGRISVFEKQTVVAQAFQPAGSGDFPAARLGHGTGMSREPADRNVCATKTEMRPQLLLLCRG